MKTPNLSSDCHARRQADLLKAVSDVIDHWPCYGDTWGLHGDVVMSKLRTAYKRCLSLYETSTPRSGLEHNVRT